MISKKVYVTKSSFCAFIDRANSRHTQANAYFRFLAENNYSLYTDAITLTWAYDEIYKNISPSLSKDFLKTIFLSNINIIYPEERDIKSALKTLTNYQSTDLTFDQALRATLANKRGISQIFTFEYLHPLFGQSAFYLPI